MFIALGNEKERVHISDSKKDTDYYCPICGESLIIRKGTINAHCFAHKKNSNCSEKDGWHYDMSDWHYNWQNQFPIKNQECVFESNNKIHRADVYINKTVFEFQHSPISESEFDDRNSFYNELGFHVIWIFDVRDKMIEHIRDVAKHSYRVFSWKYPIRFLEKSINLRGKITIFLQIDDSIWDRQSNYKSILNFQELEIYPNLIKIEDLISGLSEFISNDYYSDFEILDKFLKLNYENKEWYSYKLKPEPEFLSDYLYHSHFYDLDDKYDNGYCPKYKKDIVLGEECHGCYNYIPKYNGCNYRFREFPINIVKYFYDIKHDDEGRIVSIDCLTDSGRKIFEIPQIPSNIRSIKSFIDLNPNIRIARFRNIETGKLVQLNENNINALKKNNKCYGKLCYGNKAANQVYEIYNWNRPIWLLRWFKDADDQIIRTRYSNDNVTLDNIMYNNISISGRCQKCGKMIVLQGENGKEFVGCVDYAKCDYVI